METRATVELLPQAEAELQDLVSKFSATQRVHFLVAVADCLRQLTQFPYLGRPVLDSIRRWQLSASYSLYYDAKLAPGAEADTLITVLVLTIRDDRRNPDSLRL